MPARRVTRPIARPGGSGFTLVEILAVVVILGIGAAVIVPNLGTHDDLNAAAASRVIMADLVYAQNQAIVTQTTCYVSFSTAGQNYAVLSDKPSVSPTAYVTNPLTQQHYVTQFNSATSPQLQRSSLQSASFDGQVTLAFDELGQPLSWNPGTGTTATLASTGTIVVRSGSYTLTVSIEPYTGALSVN